MLLGSKCQNCPAREDLQFHLLFDDHGAHHKMQSVKRARFYLACAKEGLVRLLCRTCHNRAHFILRKTLRISDISVSNVKSTQPHGQG
jgi:hypothetical protein